MKFIVPRTLRARLAAATAVTILAAVVVFALITVLVVGSQLRGSLDSALRQRAEAVAELAASAPAVLNEPGALESTASGRQLAVEVIDKHGRILTSPLTLGAEVLPQNSVVTAALRSGATGFSDISLGGRQMRMFAAPIADVTGPASGGAVLVASDTSDISATIHNLVAVVALSGIGVVLVAAIAAALLTRRGLRPLQRLVVGAGEIERTADPARRLPEPVTADEIGQLTGVLNRMLASLEQSRASERRFLADASHELRTPVTALLGNVEYAARHGAEPEVIDDLRADATRLARLVDSLLALEREADPAARELVEPVALDQLARAVASEHDGERVIVAALEPVSVAGDADALRRVISNLVENGLVHGPPHGRVTVSVSRVDGRALLAVADEGAGPGAEHAGHLFERFWRGPDASGRPGSGLGLSIVAATVARHRGTIAVNGAQFEVSLPLLQRGG